jgi:LysR family transcriptional activator of nhaA
MEWLNYHHLLYFWMVVRQGGIARAGAELHLRPSTLSTQIRQLEESLGEKLFTKEGRRLVPTDAGRLVYGYADEIFSLGREILEVVKRRRGPAGLRLTVGVADAIPKLVALRLLQPALKATAPVRIVCREDRHERLLSALALHELDLVLSDVPVSSAIGVRAFNHLLGECGVTFFATPAVADRLRGRFPQNLGGARFLLPTENSSLRRSLDGWFDANSIRPAVVGEFEDDALLKAFGQADLGAFAAPSVIEREVVRQHRVRVLGRTDGIRERFYAISAERRLKHPAVVAISEAARSKLFG